MKAPRRRKCRICKRIFQPRPLAWRQKVCSRKLCQRARRRKNWQDWLRQNPDYYRAKRDGASSELEKRRLKRWRQANPHYLKRWREKNKERWKRYMREYMKKRRSLDEWA